LASTKGRRSSLRWLGEKSEQESDLPSRTGRDWEGGGNREGKPVYPRRQVILSMD